MFKRIVVGVDEHEGGRDAIALAKNLLASDGELTLAHGALPAAGAATRRGRDRGRRGGAGWCEPVVVVKG